jgi:hypothetical protein
MGPRGAMMIIYDAQMIIYGEKAGKQACLPSMPS